MWHALVTRRRLHVNQLDAFSTLWKSGALFADAALFIGVTGHSIIKAGIFGITGLKQITRSLQQLLHVPSFKLSAIGDSLHDKEMSCLF